MIFVSKDGKWYHEGAEIIHRAIFLWMIQSLEKTEDGIFIVHLNNQKCYLEVEDTPLVVQQVDLIQESPEGQANIRLTLNDESQEILNPDTLRISPENVLYCTVKNDEFPARFLRPAYYQIAENISEDDSGEFNFILNNKKYPIRSKAKNKVTETKD
jgi:Protein of unknown function (DUF1285).